jgi:hypothetical protein
MVEFEKPARFAAGPLRAYKGALALIPLPNSATDWGRDVTASECPEHSGAAFWTWSRGRTPQSRPRCDGTELPFLELVDQGVEGSVEYLSHIPRGYRMTEQGLGMPQLFTSALGDGELDKESLGGKRRRHS